MIKFIVFCVYRKLIFDSYQIRDNAKVYCLTAREWESVGTTKRIDSSRLTFWFLTFSALCFIWRFCALRRCRAKFLWLRKIVCCCLSGRNINPSGSFYESRSAYKSTFSVCLSLRALFSWRACTLLSLLLFHCSAKGSICMCCLLSFATTTKIFVNVKPKHFIILSIR